MAKSGIMCYYKFVPACLGTDYSPHGSFVYSVPKVLGFHEITLLVCIIGPPLKPLAFTGTRGIVA